jgi:hypothetical protein
VDGFLTAARVAAALGARQKGGGMKRVELYGQVRRAVYVEG